jgi:hypothetical protein
MRDDTSAAAERMAPGRWPERKAQYFPQVWQL